MRHNLPPAPKKDLLPDHVAQQIVGSMSPQEHELFIRLGGMELLRCLKEVADVEGTRLQESDLIAQLWPGKAQDPSDLVRSRTRLRVLQLRLNKRLMKSGCALRVWRLEHGQLLLNSVGPRSLLDKWTEVAEEEDDELYRLFGYPEVKEMRQFSKENSLPAQKAPSKVQRAKDFLKGILGDQQVDVNAVNCMAINKNIELPTLRRARKALHIIPRRVGFGRNGKWRISLPPEE